MKKIKVYTTPTCPWCKKVKDYLTKKKIPFESVDITRDEKAQREILEKTGQMGVPVTFVDKEIIIGYDPEAIEGALQQ